jgi:predicted pyridoxine 5'-phosphate oxidase superfamily flavin-nucleotide-binding protein
MSLSQKVRSTITSATAKALATHGQYGINIVPVSMLNITDDTIWLFDFFMNKTVSNIKTDTSVALTAWTDMVGLQIKGEAEYVTEGSMFDAAVLWVKTQNPNRVVRGLLVVKPTEVFDISPGGVFALEDLTV